GRQPGGKGLQGGAVKGRWGRGCRTGPAQAPPQSQLTPRARAPRVDDSTESSPAREASPSLSPAQSLIGRTPSQAPTNARLSTPMGERGLLRTERRPRIPQRQREPRPRLG